MEVNVTCLVEQIDPWALSHSIAEDRPCVRDFFQGFGAWEKEEIEAWSDAEIDALVLQYAAGDLRELQDIAPGDGIGGIDWDEAKKLSEQGVCGGRLFVTGMNELYIYIGD